MLLLEQSVLRLGHVVAFGMALSRTCTDGVAFHYYTVGGGKFAILYSRKTMFGDVYNWSDEG